MNNYFGVEWSVDESAEVGGGGGDIWIREFDDNGEYIGRYWVNNFVN